MSVVAPIRVLVIDDSAFSRRTITRMLERSPLVEVVAAAHDGETALRKTLELRPDLITLDLEMPGMDGFTFLRLVMSRCATPVIVISGRSGEQDVFRALDCGAVDFIAKPTPRAGAELETIEEELLRKVHAVRQLRIEKVRARLDSGPAPRGVSRQRTAAAPRVVAIGSSTGGPAALMQILSSFVEAPPVAVLICQHMPAGFTRGFAERINRVTPFAAREAENGDVPLPGSVLVAPGGRHLELEREGIRVVARIAEAVPGDKYAPAVDRLFTSAAKQFGSDLLGIVLTGMGDDGCEGVRAIKQAGGHVVAESEQTAIVFGMPHRAIRTGVVDAVLPLPEIASVIESGLAVGTPGRGVRSA